jgi:hypothetical protein
MIAGMVDPRDFDAKRKFDTPEEAYRTARHSVFVGDSGGWDVLVCRCSRSPVKIGTEMAV